jgi:hypothetical protein
MLAEPLAAITASEPVTMKMDIKLTHAKNDSKWNKIFELRMSIVNVK